MHETYKQDNMTIHNADCMKVMQQYSDNYFDLAYTYSLWAHIPPKNFECAFNEVKRISKKGYFLEFDRSHKNKSALKIKSNHVFQHDFEKKFNKYLVSKTLIKDSGGDTLYHLDFRKL